MTKSIAIWLASIVISTLAAIASPAFAQAQPTGRSFTNSIDLEFVSIPAGTFQMGAAPNDRGRSTA